MAAAAERHASYSPFFCVVSWEKREESRSQAALRWKPCSSGGGGVYVASSAAD